MAPHKNKSELILGIIMAGGVVLAGLSWYIITNDLPEQNFLWVLGIGILMIIAGLSLDR
jgi:Kef-type K+ transport system membrane component KefB